MFNQENPHQEVVTKIRGYYNPEGTDDSKLTVEEKNQQKIAIQLEVGREINHIKTKHKNSLSVHQKLFTANSVDVVNTFEKVLANPVLSDNQKLEGLQTEMSKAFKVASNVSLSSINDLQQNIKNAYAELIDSSHNCSQAELKERLVDFRNVLDFCEIQSKSGNFEGFSKRSEKSPYYAACWEMVTEINARLDRVDQRIIDNPGDYSVLKKLIDQDITDAFVAGNEKLNSKAQEQDLELNNEFTTVLSKKENVIKNILENEHDEEIQKELLEKLYLDVANEAFENLKTQKNTYWNQVASEAKKTGEEDITKLKHELQQYYLRQKIAPFNKGMLSEEELKKQQEKEGKRGEISLTLNKASKTDAEKRELNLDADREYRLNKEGRLNSGVYFKRNADGTCEFSTPRFCSSNSNSVMEALFFAGPIVAIGRAALNFATFVREESSEYFAANRLIKHAPALINAFADVKMPVIIIPHNKRLAEVLRNQEPPINVVGSSAEFSNTKKKVSDPDSLPKSPDRSRTHHEQHKGDYHSKIKSSVVKKLTEKTEDNNLLNIKKI